MAWLLGNYCKEYKRGKKLFFSLSILGSLVQALEIRLPKGRIRREKQAGVYYPMHSAYLHIHRTLQWWITQRGWWELGVYISNLGWGKEGAKSHLWKCKWLFGKLNPAFRKIYGRYNFLWQCLSGCGSVFFDKIKIVPGKKIYDNWVLLGGSAFR